MPNLYKKMQYTHFAEICDKQNMWQSHISIKLTHLYKQQQQVVDYWVQSIVYACMLVVGSKT